MTFEDVRQAALQRVAEFTERYPNGRQVPYRRIGVRQQELFAIAAHENADYAGARAIAPLDEAGAVDFRDIETPIDTPERISKIEVYELVDPDAEDPPFTVGTEVTIVPIADRDGVAPRATLRNGVLRPVDDELATIAKVEVFYPYRPATAAATETGTREVEVADPYSELLVIDLAKDYLRKALQLDAKDRTVIIGLLGEEEGPMLERWIAHVREYAPVQSRFRRPPHGPRR